MLCALFVACAPESSNRAPQKDEPVMVDEAALMAHPAYAGLLSLAQAKGKDVRWLNARATIADGAIVLGDEDVQALEDVSIEVATPVLPDVKSPTVTAGCSTTQTWCPGYGGVPGISGKTFRAASSGYGTQTCRYTNTGTSAPSYYYSSSPAGVYPCDKCCPDSACAAWGGTSPSPLGYCVQR